MDEIRKAAILLLTLEKPVAAEVLSQMPRELVERVSLEIARIEGVTKQEQAEVLAEFESQARERLPIESGSVDLAGDLLEQSLGKEGAGTILENVRQTISAVPFSFLLKAGPDQLLTFIVEEYPQTIALVLSHLPASLAAEVLAGLPSNKQIEVVRRVAHMEQTNPDVVRDVETSLKSRMTSSFAQSMEAAGGIPAVAQILNVTDRMTNKGILETLEQDDPDLVEEIKRLMFVFDDLLKLDDRAIQSLLKEVETSQWATALKGASTEIRDRILGNLSQRAAELLKEEMEYLGPVRVSDVEAMQQQIVDAVRRLEDSGEIQIANGAENDQFVS